MENSWYKLKYTPIEYVNNQDLKDLIKIIKLLSDNVSFSERVMVFIPLYMDIQNTTLFFPPKTVNLMLEKALILCGAEKCPQPDINDIIVYIGNNKKKHHFFSDN